MLPDRKLSTPTLTGTCLMAARGLISLGNSLPERVALARSATNARENNEVLMDVNQKKTTLQARFIGTADDFRSFFRPERSIILSKSAICILKHPISIYTMMKIEKMLFEIDHQEQPCKVIV